jgi:hypothetical protein
MYAWIVVANARTLIGLVLDIIEVGDAILIVQLLGG